MKKRRRHRLYLDVTYSRTMSRRDAAAITEMLLNNAELECHPVWLPSGTKLNKMTIIQPRKQGT